jgi:predicted Fe-S protein YdhL (DUF1289 family)
MTVASPCISLCRMNAESGLCEGCFRSLDEIARWGSRSDAEKRDILARVSERRSALKPGAASTPVAGGVNE